MNIFSEVKEQLTTRQVAESYGLRIRKNGVACCPFHDDRHPSMKVDQNYHCFACGVGGDVIDYTARIREKLHRYQQESRQQPKQSAKKKYTDRER